ncbi:DUF427 domain-containing protein [Undibacterium sp. CY18W]|uniref:DUF427 domain-containing protein n=1 Tax=Undibacterium hunanense TaxID=2762292 RepID=A0ABR6ZWP0_9BURK|nr:DUF427 domain-containing protein [Undibacterium hunanense]MBC3920199.1 DUF427 domain-containing protein [Undibacterium hunanense]
MPTAKWKDTIIAQATDAEVVKVEGNTYFPMTSVHQEYLRESEKHTVCGWKGTASYYDIVVNGQANTDAAWTYPTPKDAAKEIVGFIAFWRGVEVSP